MKKYLFAIAALGLLGACNNAGKNQPVGVVEEETMEVVSVPIQSQPTLPVVKEKAKAKPINMRDSLTVDKAKGAITQKEYKGMLKAPKNTTSTTPAAMPEEVEYDLTMYYQDGDTVGVYELDAVYPVDGQPQKFVQTGKTTKQVGTPSNPAAVVYVFVPADGTDTFYFLQNGNEMELLNEELNPYTGEGCYTLLLVE
jgi:hypothetical protein